MTIYCIWTSNTELGSRLPFGVPLEDISPRWDIHPYLRKIFDKAYRDIISGGYAIEEVIRKQQGPIAERLVLKEIVATCKPMPFTVSPGALLWILRHFLGLLPVPLLSDYANKQYYNWKHLTRFCKKYFVKHASVSDSNRLLINKLADELSRLPPPNLLLFGVLLNFIRLLSYQEQGRCKRSLNKTATFHLVQYFSSSIFIRPYVPGRNSRIDRYYFPLLLYIVFKWHEIEKRLKSISNSSTQLIDSAKLFINRAQISCSSRKVKIRDNFTQTEEYMYTSSLDSFSEVSFDVLNISRDTGCQTERTLSIEEYTNRRCYRCCCSYGRNYESNLTEVALNNIKFCQTQSGENTIAELLYNDTITDTVNPLNRVVSRADVSTNTEIVDHYDSMTPSNLPKGLHKDINQTVVTNGQYVNGIDQLFSKTDIGTNTEDLHYYGWINPVISHENDKKSDLNSPATFITDSEYIYDDYTGSTLNLLGDVNPEGVALKNQNLLDRVSKIGWTYTPPKITPVSSSLTSPKTESKTALKNYTLYYNQKEQFNKEEKEICSSNDSLQSKRSTTISKSRKSFSIANIKNKFDFFKLLNNKKNKLKNSWSMEEISNIKYKKMNSTKSNLF